MLEGTKRLAKCVILLTAPALVCGAQTIHPNNPALSDLRRELLAHVAIDDVPAVVVAVSKGHKILWEEGFGWADREKQLPATVTTSFYVASITKSLTATAMLQLAERGQIQLDDPANKYLGPAKLYSPMWNVEGATVRRLLTHTSGLTTFSRSCTSTTDARCNIDMEIENYGVLVWPPGEEFDYSNLGYGVLGDIVGRVSGQSFASYLNSAIFQPLGMQNCSLGIPGSGVHAIAAGYDEKTHARSAVRVSGHEGASGLYCSASDLLSFGRFNLKQRTRHRSPLSSHDLDEMHSAQPGTEGKYGLGWWIRQESGIQIISAQGGTSYAYALIELIPTKDIVIVVLANSCSRLVSDLERRIAASLLPGFSSQERPNNSEPAPAVPAALIGKWSGQFITNKGAVRIALQIDSNGSAQAEVGDQPKQTMSDCSFDMHHFYGQLKGEPGLLDSPDGQYMIELYLGLRNAELVGGATFGPVAAESGDQLPHFVRLVKAKLQGSTPESGPP